MNKQDTIKIDINDKFYAAFGFHQSGNLTDAELNYRKIITIDPNHFDSLHLLGVLESQKGNYDQALNLMRKAIQINSNNALIYNNLSIVCSDLRMYKDAHDYCEKALLINPDYLDALTNKGKILIELKKIKDAKLLLLNLKKKYPKHAEFYYNLGIIFREENQYIKAIKYFKEAIQINPSYSLAYFSLGNLYLLNNDNEKAKKYYEHCLKLNYEISKVYNNLGQVYENQKNLESAEQCYEQAIKSNQKEQKAWHNLINLQLISSNWSKIDSYIDIYKNKDAFYQYGLPINLQAILDDPELQKFCNENFMSYKPETDLNFIQAKTNSKIKIGYFSADFSDNNPVAYLISDLIKYHNRSKFKIYGFSLKDQKIRDNIRKFYENTFDKFFNIQDLSNNEIKDLCASINLDIAIDLNGYTKFSKPEIFSKKLAPVQINFLGYPGTMGSKNYDYIIADKTIIPENFKNYYSENIIYLPDTYFINPSTRPISSTSFTKEDLSIPKDAFVYCCFNQNYKILPSVFDTWMNILKQVRGSILLLSHTNKRAISNLKNEAKKRNVNPDRIIFTTYIKNIADHLKRYEVTDLFLDTMPYNAHTTASDAIWSGVPLITCIGKSFASRVSSSILKSVGLDYLVTKSLKEYEKKAIEIAKNTELLSNLKRKITVDKCNLVLFNSKRYTRNLENSFEKIYSIFKNRNQLSDIEI